MQHHIFQLRSIQAKEDFKGILHCYDQSGKIKRISWGEDSQDPSFVIELKQMQGTKPIHYLMISSPMLTKDKEANDYLKTVDELFRFVIAHITVIKLSKRLNIGFKRTHNRPVIKFLG